MSVNSRPSELLVRETKINILNTIRENEGISRLEIAGKTGHSTATVTRIVEALINEDDLVEESGNKSMPKGRPRKSLYFKGYDKYIIGIDLGTTYIRGVLSDYNTESIKEIEIVTEANKGKRHVLSRVVNVIENLRNTTLVDNSKIKGVGIAVAGLINTSKDIIEYSPAFDWHNVDVRKAISESVKLPVFYDNVSRVMALGELSFGKGRAYDNFVVVNVGYGIGAGIILDRKPFYGTNGISGEFGHFPVSGDNLIKCSCGNTSCLTAYASGDAIAKRAIMQLEKGAKSILPMLVEKKYELIDAEIIATAAEQGDELCQKIFRDGMDYLGASIAGIINVLNPQAVFIGGGVALNGKVFWDNLRESISNNLVERKSSRCEILPVTFPGKSALYGSISLVLREVLNFNI